MLTDMFSLPQLVTLFEDSAYNKTETQYQLISQIDYDVGTCLQKEVYRNPELTITIPYNGANVAFMVSVLSILGLHKIKFCKSYDGTHLFKIGISGMQISE